MATKKKTKKKAEPGAMFITTELASYKGSDPEGGGGGALLPRDCVMHVGGPGATVEAVKGLNNSVLAMKVEILTPLKGYKGAQVTGRPPYTGTVQSGKNKGEPNNLRIGDLFRSMGWSEEKIQALSKKKKMAGADLAKLVQDGLRKTGAYATIKASPNQEGTRVFSNLNGFVGKEYFMERFERDDGSGSAITWPYTDTRVRDILSGDDSEAEEEPGDIVEEDEEEEAAPKKKSKVKGKKAKEEEEEEKEEEESEEEESEEEEEEESEEEESEEEEEEEEEEDEEEEEEEEEAEEDEEEDEEEEEEEAGDDDDDLEAALGKTRSKAPKKKAPVKKGKKK